LDTFALAFICTGNRVRSPLAQALVRRLTTGLPVKTESFGTLDLGEVPALPEALELGRSCGVDLSAHHARFVRSTSLAHLDLVLGFEEQHVREAVVHADAPRSKTFTVRHFSRLLASLSPVTDLDPVTRARIKVAQADAQRDELQASFADEMRDPLGGSWKLYHDTGVEIREHSLALVAALFGIDNPDVLLPVPAKRPQSRLRRCLRPRQR
jgi:protein-tyrosine-phosphatase